MCGDQMKYLITGGAGFIGSNFCEYVTNKNLKDEFVCLDELTYAGSMDNLNNVINKKNFKFIKGNICNKIFIDELFEKENFDIVINFAAESHVDNSIKDSGIFIETNVKGVQVLLEASRKYNIKRFHQVSTDEVYGDVDYDSRITFEETMILNPTNPYSASKASADLLVLSYHKTYGLNVTISRSSNNYGKNQHEEKLIPKIINNALIDKKIPIYGKGINIRDWLYVEDCCIAIDLIVRYGKSGEIYNISSHNEIRNIDIAKLILKELNKSENLIEYVTDRPSNDKRYPLNTTKIENELIWTAKKDFKTGLKETIEYYLNKNTK